MRRHRHSRFNFILLFSLLFSMGWILLFSAMSNQLRDKSYREQAISLQHALNHAVTDCYALEGRYPPDLAYMKEHYGLTYDESLFYVTYRPIASNIRPEYFIVEKNGTFSGFSGSDVSQSTREELP